MFDSKLKETVSDMEWSGGIKDPLCDPRFFEMIETVEGLAEDCKPYELCKYINMEMGGYARTFPNNLDFIQLHFNAGASDLTGADSLEIKRDDGRYNAGNRLWKDGSGTLLESWKGGRELAGVVVAWGLEQARMQAAYHKGKPEGRAAGEFLVQRAFKQKMKQTPEMKKAGNVIPYLSFDESKPAESAWGTINQYNMPSRAMSYEEAVAHMDNCIGGQSAIVWRHGKGPGKWANLADVRREKKPDVADYEFQNAPDSTAKAGKAKSKKA